MGSRSSYAVPLYSPAFANARRWTVALSFGSLFRAVGGTDPDFDHIVDDTALQSFRHDPDDGAAVHCASDIGTDPCKFVGAFRDAGIYDPSCDPPHRSGVRCEVLPLDIIEGLNWPS